jgi:hypothetical protein
MLAKGGEAMLQPAVKLRTALDNFLARAAAVGDQPWGTDQFGQKVQEAYVKSKVGDVLQSVQNLADGIVETQARLVTMATQYRRAEIANQQ